MNIEKEMASSLKGIPFMTNTPHAILADLLTERAKTHGDFAYHANITQQIKRCIWEAHKVGLASDTPVKCMSLLSDIQRESLDMIAHKIGRILAGDPDFRDHWDDIAGYAKLVADRCSK